MACKASEFINVLESWVGRKESNGSHKVIIDTYNRWRPLPRGYKVKYTDAWCATGLSAAAIEVGATDICPIECGCGELVKIAKQMGIWIENENRVPNLGEWVLYDWDDNKQTFRVTDNTGWPEHVGAVIRVDVARGKFLVAECNINDSVGYRELEINGLYIRGFITPKYLPESTQAQVTTPSSSKFNPKVKEFQDAAIADGFKFPKWGADGEWGEECEEVAEKAIVKERWSDGKRVWKYPNLTKFVQKELGFTGDDIDGKCGDDTGDRIEEFQGERGIEQDRCCGINTYKEILGV